MTHVSGNEKILHPGGRKLILFNQFSGHILCPSLVSFAFLILVFFVCLFDVFLNQKCIFWYPFEYLTKTFSPGRFPETWLLFLALIHFFKFTQLIFVNCIIWNSIVSFTEKWNAIIAENTAHDLVIWIYATSSEIIKF